MANDNTNDEKQIIVRNGNGRILMQITDNYEFELFNIDQSKVGVLSWQGESLSFIGKMDDSALALFESMDILTEMSKEFMEGKPEKEEKKEYPY